MQPKEIGIPKEIIIEGQEIVKALSSPRFSRILKRQTKLLLQTDEEIETGLDVIRNMSRKTHHFVEKQNVGPREVGVDGEEYENLLESGNYFTIIDVHLHPGSFTSDETTVYSTKDFAPSVNDLETTIRNISVDEGLIGLSSNPVQVIAIVIGEETKMLMFQPTEFAVLYPNFDSDYSNDLANIKGPKDIADSLEQFGFKSTYVTLTPEGFSDDDKSEIRLFGFTAKRVEGFIKPQDLM